MNDIDVFTDTEFEIEIEANTKEKTSKPTIKSESPFNKFFSDIHTSVLEIESIGLDKNAYFNNGVLSIIESYMYLFPPWCGIYLYNESSSQRYSRYTNCFVEYWFKIVKRDILQGRLRQKIGRFVRTMYKNLKGRLSEFKINQYRQKGKNN